MEEHHYDHHSHGRLWLIAASAVLLAAAMTIERLFPGLSTWQLLLVYLVSYLLVGHDTLHEAVEGIAHGEALNEHFLMSIATIGALAIGFMPGAENEFAEAVFVMLFFQVGEMFEEYAEGQSRKSIAHLMDIRPDVAHVENQGSPTDMAPDEVAIGSGIVVRPGERVPIDGIVTEGSSTLDTVALTGESVPRGVTVGDEVVSGCVNLSGVLKLRTTKSYGESTVAKIIDLVENAGDKKSKSEAFITRFARVYTPVVVFSAVALALLPPLLTSLTSQPSTFTTLFPLWLHRALIFLVVSCPCALVISVPLTFFGGIGGASRAGILVKGGNYLDVLSKVKTIVFDKTGTLTHGRFSVTSVHPDESILHLAAHAEHFSTHPIGAALRDAFPEEATDGCAVSDVEELAGYGIRAKVTDTCDSGEQKTYRVCVGNTKLMEAEEAEWQSPATAGTVVHVAIDGEYAGHIVTGDTIKDDSREAIASLKRLGVSRTVMLTGDHKDVGEEVARSLGIDEWHAELLPADKVAFVERMASEAAPVAFVGDGINDAPALARADVGIAMGALGSDAAIEAADVVVMDDKPSKIATAIDIARRTIGIARQNVTLAIGVKAAVLLLAAVGVGTMWMAVFADVGVTVLAVLNAMRAMRV
jgi:Cd2+/Zn2+-exporting ATPase